MAVTAPIWVEQPRAAEIRNLTCQTAVPVQDQTITLTMELENPASAPLTVDSVQVLADGTLLQEFRELGTIPAGSGKPQTIGFSCDAIGQTRLTVRLIGSLEGIPQTAEASIDVSIRRSREVSEILVDSSHGNAGLDALSELEALAGKSGIRLTVSREPVTAQQLENCRLLIITTPKSDFEESFFRRLRAE